MQFDTRLKDGRTLLIKHAQPTDAAKIVAYVDRTSGESDFFSFGPGEFEMTVEEETNFIRDLGGGEYGFMLKGIVEDRVVSICTITRSKRPRLRHIGAFGISVSRSHWGLGIGKQMCLGMLAAARKVGVTKVNLSVREDNANAIHLYESVGFLPPIPRPRAPGR